MKEQTLVLPEAICGYFDGTNSQQADAACSNFTLDAVVTDNGETLHGSPAILAWIRRTMEEFGAVAEPLHLAESDGKHIVTARVSGNFPGSPVELDFAFTLRDGKIANLDVA